MKVLIASLFLVGFMSCAHHGEKKCCTKGEESKCSDGSCDLKKDKKCCKDKKMGDKDMKEGAKKNERRCQRDEN